jgi:acylpyruvate hydrolase
MRFIAYERNGTRGLAVADQAGRHWGLDDAGTPSRLESALANGRDGLKDLAAALLKGEPIDPEAVTFLPPLSSPSKIICVGLNYADHTAESSIQQPDYPTLFGRFSSSLIGHGAPKRSTTKGSLSQSSGVAVAISPSPLHSTMSPDIRSSTMARSGISSSERHNGPWARILTAPEHSGRRL